MQQDSGAQLSLAGAQDDREQDDEITSHALAPHTSPVVWVSGTSPQPQGQGTDRRALNPHQVPRSHTPNNALTPSTLVGAGAVAAGAVLAPQPLPLLPAILAALWQRSWLAGSQGLSSMGGRPFRGSEAWEMFIAWPQRCLRAAWGRRRAKAAQAALQSQLCSSQGHSRGGEEKPLLANTQLRKLCLSQPELLQPRLCWPRGWDASAKASQALQDLQERWPGTWVMAEAWSPWWKGLRSAEVRCSQPCPAALPSCWAGRGNAGAAHGQAGSCVSLAAPAQHPKLCSADAFWVLPCNQEPWDTAAWFMPTETLEVS